MKTNGNTKSLASYIHLYIGSKVWTSHLALNNGEPQALTISINRGFDLFGLCDAGLAINAKDTQNQTN